MDTIPFNFKYIYCK